MRTLEDVVEHIDKRLWNLSPKQVRALEQALERLTPEQRRYGRSVIERSRLERRAPRCHLNQLDYALESWWAHSLATRLAIVHCLWQLEEDGQSWPASSRDEPVLKRFLNEVGREAIQWSPTPAYHGGSSQTMARSQS